MEEKVCKRFHHLIIYPVEINGIMKRRLRKEKANFFFIDCIWLRFLRCCIKPSLHWITYFNIGLIQVVQNTKFDLKLRLIKSCVHTRIQLYTLYCIVVLLSSFWLSYLGNCVQSCIRLITLVPSCTKLSN